MLCGHILIAKAGCSHYMVDFSILSDISVETGTVKVSSFVGGARKFNSMEPR